MAEGEIRIPLDSLMRKQEGLITGLGDQLVDLSSGYKSVKIFDREQMDSLVSGIDEPLRRILLDYFELKYALFSKNHVVFPADPKFSPDILENSSRFGLTPVDVPGFTGVPQLIDFLRANIIDMDIFYRLWPYVAPNVPRIISTTIERNRIDYGSDFLSGIMSVNPNDQAIEGNYARYELTLDEPKVMFAETFPDPYGEERPKYTNSLLLERLGVGRTSVGRKTLQDSIESNGSGLIRELGLNPEEWKLGLIRYEDFLRLGRQYRWGCGRLETFMDGWYKKDAELIPMLAGGAYTNEYQDLGGLSRCYPINPRLAKERREVGSTGIQARFAITRSE